MTDKTNKTDKTDKTVIVSKEKDKETKTSKIKLIIDAFENNIQLNNKASREPDNIDVQKYKKPTKDAFKVLMGSSQNLGTLTPSPRRKNPKTKVIGQRQQKLDKFWN